jgi:hypothetical protein
MKRRRYFFTPIRVTVATAFTALTSTTLALDQKQLFTEFANFFIRKLALFRSPRQRHDDRLGRDVYLGAGWRMVAADPR